VPVSFSAPFVKMANGAVQDYRCFVATTTGYFSVENFAGDLKIFRAGHLNEIPASDSISIWSCAGPEDPDPFGGIVVLGCHDLDLTHLDVHGLSSLATLDCSQNKLTELDLSGLVALENFYAHGNPFSSLDLSPCHSLKYVGYASRYLGYSNSPPAWLTGSLICHDGPLFWFHPKEFTGLFNETNNSFCAERYISPRTRTITTEEAEIRAIAYALKDANLEAIAVAAPAMADLIDGPCWLVPIPASDTTLNANLALARAIAAIVPGARVKLAIERTRTVESSTARRRKSKFGLEPHQHHFARTAGPLNPLPLYFVDNVITTGNTVRAARAALGWGTGLAYADASIPFNQLLRKVTKAEPDSELIH